MEMFTHLFFSAFFIIVRYNLIDRQDVVARDRHEAEKMEGQLQGPLFFTQKSRYQNSYSNL